MTDDSHPGPHEGRSLDTLFESLPDPLLAFARERGGDADSNTEQIVVLAVNPAFERTFDVGIDEGVPLDEVLLTGAAVANRDVGDTTGDEPPSDPVDDRASEAVADDGDDETDVTVTVPSTSVGSLLDRARRDVDTAVVLRHATDDGTRHFHVRTVTGENGDEGYLLFLDVSDLERCRRELATTVEQFERIASVVRHDVRNPLEVASIRLDAARDTGEDVHFEKVAGALDRIEQIVGEVLVVDAGSIEPTATVALDSVVEAAWQTVDTADATLVTASGLPVTQGDADRLQRLFENLFRNAVEHAGRDVTVTVEPLPDGFAVSDDGPGVPTKIGTRAFEVGTSSESEHSGFGLSIVSRVAREHGWQVSLASAQQSASSPGPGARFEFTGVERVDRANG